MIDLDADPGRKEVFAHFGFAVGMAQSVERLLGRLVTMHDMATAQTPADRASKVREADQAPLGALRKRFRELGEPGLADTALAAVNAARNMTVHRFFWDEQRSAKLNTTSGQAALIRELDTLSADWFAVDGLIRAALIRKGLDLTHGAQPVIQRIRDLQQSVARGEAPTGGPFTEAAASLIEGSPDAVERIIAQLESADQPEGARKRGV